MISYAHLPEDQRWALAFYVGQLAFPADGAARGEALWRDNAEVRAAIPDLTALVQVRPAGLGGLDQAAADDITAYLRRQPQSAMEIAQAGQAAGALALARTRLDRKSVVLGKSVSVRVDLGGRRLIKNKQICNKTLYTHQTTNKN